MNDINLIDETLDLNLTQSYILNINIANNNFEFAIFDPLRNKYIGIISFETETSKNKDLYIQDLFKFINSNDIIKLRYKNVYCNIQTQRYSNIPKPLFESNNLEKLFSFSNELLKSDKIQYNYLKNSNSYIIYPIDYSLESVLVSFYSNITFYHHLFPIIENKILLNKNKNNYKIFINISKNFFDSVVINSNKLILANSFSFENDDDFMYFFLLIFEQLNLNPEETEVILTGNIRKEDELFNKTKKYVRNIKFDKYDDYFTYSYIFFELNSYKYSNFLNLIKCV